MAALDENAMYTIKLKGRIEENLADWIGPIHVVTNTTEGGSAITTLSGIVTDQAGLVGLTRRLHWLGIVLLSVERADVRQQDF